MNVITYQGYTAIVEYDDEDGMLHGRVLGITEVILCEGSNATELKQDLADAIDEYFDDCAAEGREPAKPFSGNLRVRLGSDLHRAATLAASQAGLSLNEWLKRVVQSAANRREVSAQIDEGREPAIA